jgi:septum formation inhibitor MinC
VPVIALVVRDPDPARLHAEAARKITEAAGDLAGGLGVIDLSQLPGEVVALAPLAEIVRRLGLSPVAVIGADPENEFEARALGLAMLPSTAPRASATPRPAGQSRSGTEARAEGQARVAETAGPRPSPSSGEGYDPVAGAAAGAPLPGGDTAPGASDARDAQDSRRESRAPGSAGAQAPGEHDEPGALVIDRPLRSGQRIYARGRDLVLMAGTSPGSEVIADGSVHCYGPLRGRAIAGASGATGAHVFTLDFQAELVAIAGIYRTFENMPVDAAGKPVRASLRIDGEQRLIVLSPLAGR